MNDERKTKKQLIAELEVIRGEVADKDGELVALRQKAGGDFSVVERQLAVERLRSEAIAMRSSDDLNIVVAVMWRMMRELGIETPAVSILFFDADTARRIAYTAVDNPRKLDLSVPLDHPSIVEIDTDILVIKFEGDIGDSGAAKAWKKQQVESYRRELSIEGHINWYKSYGIKGDFSKLSRAFEIWKPMIINVPFAQGTVGFQVEEYNEDNVATVQDLTEALSLGYLRFLDYRQLEQQAESLKEQAEQARRERTVERVRAEAMSMRQSDDLLKVVGVIFQEMLALGIASNGCSIQFLEVESGYYGVYYAHKSPKKLGLMWTSPYVKEFNEEILVWENTKILNKIVPHHQDHITRWRKGEAWQQEVNEDWIEGYFQNISSTMGLGQIFPHKRQEKWIVTNVPFAHGTVGFHEPIFEKSHVKIVQEFTEALSLGYLRFLDFQKVDEAQRQLIDELEEELQTAHTLQMGLMPTESPQIEGFDITGRCIPANHVGGDFYQYFEQDGKLSICMADVTGHAMEAAVPVMMFSGVLKTEMGYGHSVERLFAKLNDTMNSSLDSRTYVCFTMGELDLGDHTFRMANSGCPYPFHFRASTGDVTELQVDAYPLGVRAETAYTTVETGLEMGDYIVFCSDGIIEAGNADEEIFGFEETAETIRTGCAEGLSAEALIDRLIGAVQGFAGDEPQGDDMTCVVLRVEG